MRISDWSSDVCSSDLEHEGDAGPDHGRASEGAGAKHVGHATPAAGQTAEAVFPTTDLAAHELADARAAAHHGVVQLAVGDAPEALDLGSCRTDLAEPAEVPRPGAEDVASLAPATHEPAVEQRAEERVVGKEGGRTGK